MHREKEVVEREVVIQQLKSLLASQRRNQSDLANHMSVTRAYVSAVMRGKAAIPQSMLDMVGYERVTLYRKKAS